MNKDILTLIQEAFDKNNVISFECVPRSHAKLNYENRFVLEMKENSFVHINALVGKPSPMVETEVSSVLLVIEVPDKINSNNRPVFNYDNLERIRNKSIKQKKVRLPYGGHNLYVRKNK